MYQVLVDKQRYSEKNHHQKKLYHGNNLNQVLQVSQFYLVLLLINAAFVANVASFVFKWKFFARLEILDLLTDSFYFIFASDMSLVNVL